MCIKPILHSLFKSCFDFRWYVLRFIWIFLHRLKSIFGNYFTTSKYELSISSYIDLQNGCFILAMFSMYTFIVSWYSKVFFSSYIVTTMYFFVIISFASAFTSESSLASSATFYSSSCNKTGPPPNPRNWLFLCIYSYTSLFFIHYWCSFKEIICI